MEKKVYNLKKTSLGKVSFLDGTTFCMIQGAANKDQVFKELIIYKTVEEAIKKFPQGGSEVIYSNINDKLTIDNKIIDGLIQDGQKAIVSLKNEMYENYAFEEFKNMTPIEFIKSEPEMIALTLVHIAVKYTNGFLSVPINNIEISIRFVKNILTINFGEEGNPKSEKPQI